MHGLRYCLGIVNPLGNENGTDGPVLAELLGAEPGNCGVTAGKCVAIGFVTVGNVAVGVDTGLVVTPSRAVAKFTGVLRVPEPPVDVCGNVTRAEEGCTFCTRGNWPIAGFTFKLVLGFAAEFTD